MKLFKLLVISACVASMTGCGSSSDTKTTPTKVTSPTKVIPPVQNLPLTDYDFSDSELDELLKERSEILASVNLTFEGKSYSKVMYAQDLSDEVLAITLQNADKEYVNLVISKSFSSDNGNTGVCLFYKDKAPIDYDTFKCDESNTTQTDDMTLIQSTLTKGQSDIQIEFDTEFLEEGLGLVGNTVLLAGVGDNNVTIITSYAYADLMKDIYNIDNAGSTLGVTTYLRMKELTEKYEGSNMTLNFTSNIYGSEDDDINMYTGLMIKANNMTTVVTETGSVFSGGTDLFAAGYPRILKRATKTESFEINQQIGVHSWSDGERSALEIPYSDESHRKQATYFNKMLGDKGVDFYIFTLESAKPDGAHWVTQADSDKYGFITTIE